MRRFLQSIWFKILAVLLVILIALTVVAGIIGSRSSPLTAVTGTVTEPLAYAVTVVGKGFRQIGLFLKRPSDYEKQIKELQGQVTEYQKELADYESTKERLSLYEDFLDIKRENKDYQVTAATVIGKDASHNYATFILNKGTLSNIRVNDPVICGQGQLVGVVTKTAPTYCVVSTLLDPTISVSAYDIRTRENGYITNTSKLAAKGYCRMSGLDRATAVSKGGIVTTAGVGGIYPRDLIIGTVRDVRNDDHDISAYAVVKPNVAIAEVNEVLVITSFKGQGISVTGGTDAEGEDATSPDVQESTEKDKDSSSSSSAASTSQRVTTSRRATTFSSTTAEPTTPRSTTAVPSDGTPVDPDDE